MNSLTEQLSESKNYLVKELEDLQKIDLDGAIKFRETVQKFDETIAELNTNRQAYIDEYSNKCSHPPKFLVSHVDYSGYYIFDFRVCKLCGLQEDYPFKSLQYYGDVPSVSFDDAMKIRLLKV